MESPIEKWILACFRPVACDNIIKTGEKNTGNLGKAGRETDIREVQSGRKARPSRMGLRENGKEYGFPRPGKSETRSLDTEESGMMGTTDGPPEPGIVFKRS